jgi:hopanoid biosynthesis associated protein HpnK
VNADDFGLSTGVNQGIIDCFEQGILRSASLMPNGAAFDDAVRLARHTPGLGVGVHISLVAEPCVAPRHELGGLADADGSLPSSYAAFTRGYCTRRFTRRAIQREVEAQMQRVLATDLTLTHLDSHQHVHLLPGVFDIVADAARSAGIAVIRVPHERRLHRPRRLDMRNVQLQVLLALCRRARGRAHASELRTAHRFFGLSVSGALNEAALLHILHHVSPGVNEIMAHPGISDAELRRRYQWGYDWDNEAAALQSPTVRHLVEQRGIRLAHFGNAWSSEEREELT